MIYDGKKWHVVDALHSNLNSWQDSWLKKKNMSDEYLEELYPELRKLKEAYIEKRDELKVFEILKLDETS